MDIFPLFSYFSWLIVLEDIERLGSKPLAAPSGSSVGVAPASGLAHAYAVTVLYNNILIAFIRT
jgi:hypothetical protein